MPRRPRIHTPHGLYYVVLRGYDGQTIFFGDEDYRTFGRLTALSLKRARAHLHAFCWLAQRAEFAVQVSDLPVCRFVHFLTSHYANRLRRKYRRSGRCFASRYRALLVDHDRYLPELVRYIHRAPVRAALVHDAARHPWSSHRAYLGDTRLSWLTTNAALALIEVPGGTPHERYRIFAQQRDDRAAVHRFEHGHPDDSRIAGDDAFIATLQEGSDLPRTDDALAALIESVATSQRVAITELFSLSRRRRVVLARALITWQATQSGASTLTEVATHLRRSPSTLWAAVERYRAQRPELFTPPDDDAAPSED